MVEPAAQQPGHPDDTAFVGLGNYATILTDRYWWTTLLVTLSITVVSVTIEFVVGLALALVMHRTVLGRGWCEPRC